MIGYYKASNPVSKTPMAVTPDGRKIKAKHRCRMPMIFSCSQLSTRRFRRQIGWNKARVAALAARACYLLSSLNGRYGEKVTAYRRWRGNEVDRRALQGLFAVLFLLW